jgi:quinol monooxygenase YgiN
MRNSFKHIIAGAVISLFFIDSISISPAQDLQAPVVTVIHVDVMPQFTKSAANLLLGFRNGSLREAGPKTFEVLQEIDHPNHFTLVEAWRSEKDYEAHNITVQTRHFRDQLQPMLGSPFDERIHRELITAPY